MRLEIKFSDDLGDVARGFFVSSIQSKLIDGKAVVEDCLALDLAWLMRLGPIRDGQSGKGEIKWRIDDVPVQSVSFLLDLQTSDSARLTIWAASIAQTIILTAVPQNFGGRRWWMRCPVTGERSRCLYLPPGGTRFASRAALGLPYRVERLTRFDRPFEKLFRAQRRLGRAAGLETGVARPKGMWRRTFARHLKRFAILDEGCARQIGVLIERAVGGP